MKPYVLVLPFDFNGKEDCMYPVILEGSSELVLVDCGYPGFLPLIEHAASQVSINLQDLTGIIITHHDMDHMGSLFELKAKYPYVKVYSSQIEKPFIDGSRRSLRLVQAEDLFHLLPDDQKEGALAFQESLKNVRNVPVDYILLEDSDPPFSPDVKVIHTPGHMPGHISLYLPKSKTLIAADAVVYENGELEIANPGFTLDLPGAIDSVRKLQLLQIEEIICYHGGAVRGNIQEKLSNLVSRYTS